MNSFQKIVWPVLFLLLMQSCRKDPLSDLTFDESRIYVTNNDPDINYTDYTSFSMGDSAVVIDNGFYYTELTDVDQAYIDAIKSSMQARGFVEVSKDDAPDLGINLTRFYSTSTGIIDNGYWGGYGGYYDPYYWGYGGYGYGGAPFYTTYSYTEGAITLDILDLKNATENGTINIIWNGLIRGSGIFSSTTAAGSVDALFNQSPYIQR
mgnify:FL=1